MIAKKLKELREKKEMSQAELANILDVAQQTVASWEKEKSSPNYGILIKLADYFNVSTDILLGRSGKTTIPSEPLTEDERATLPLLPLSEDEREHLKQYRAVGESGRELVDGLTRNLYDQHLSKSDAESSGTTKTG